MALLNEISCIPNEYKLNIWDNGKYGAIKPNEQGNYIFFEFKYEAKLNITSAVYPKEYEEFLIPITYGFVSFWLRNRRVSRSADSFAKDYFTTKELYVLYVHERKSEYFDEMHKRCSTISDSELETLFYEQNFVVATEKELIDKSARLLEFLDKEDKKEHDDVMCNFLEYIKNVVKPYQHFSEDRNNTEKTLINEEALFNGYKSYVESVFTKSYRFCEENYQTYPNVKIAFEQCIDPNKPTQVPIFMQACIKCGCIRKNASLDRHTIVKALMGLGLVTLDEGDAFTKYRESIGRKFYRMEGKEMLKKDIPIYDSVCETLHRPVKGSLIKK